MAKKKVFIAVAIFALVSNVFAQQEISDFFEKTDFFLKQIVNNGLVDYEKIKGEPHQLNALLKDIRNINFSDLNNGDQEKAYLINVYNLLVIKSVLDYYPLKSVMDVNGFFEKDIIQISGEDYSLNKIEKEILFKKYSDPRLHFVLVCAAIGCPQLINAAYLPDESDKQLDDRTMITLNDNRYVKTDPESETVYISELFSWYKKDFTQNDFSGIEYINQYRKEKIPIEYKVSYITYDWKLNNLIKKKLNFKFDGESNLQAYTPSTLLKPQQIEIKVFNNLYSQTAYFDEESKKKVLNKRETYFTGIINSLYGITPDLNVGIDIYVKSVRNDKEASSPFSIFKFSTDVNSRTALSQLGPKIKFSPFRTIRNLAVQSTFLLALQSDLDGSEDPNSPYLDVEGSQWWTQLFYDYFLNPELLLYFETGFFIRFNADNQKLFTPIKTFINYYPSQDWTIYVPLEFNAFWHDSSISAHYIQTGLGGKYQLTSNFELEILYTKFIFGKSQGAGATYNLGIRIII